MKKIISLIFALLLSAVYALADDISREQALQIASQFASHPFTKKLSKRQAPAQPATPMLAHCMKSQVQAGKDNVYVVNLGGGQGFVVISGETGTDDEVLGYCDHGSFSYDSCPIQMKDLLASYSTTIDSLRQSPVLASPRLAPALPSYIGNIQVGPLLTTTWNQWGPYNANCPTGCPSGCVPTAIAQVMNYWKWPEKAIGDFSGHTYDWDNMLDDYDKSRYNDVQANAVATLMADIGKAFGTRYAPEGSSTGFDPQPLIDYFGYQPDIAVQHGVTAAELKNAMITELTNGRPVLYSGYPDFEMKGAGHALVCDGYTSNDYFHFNYGWGGACDGFYKSALVSGYQCQAAIFTNVRPYDAIRKVIDNIEYGLLQDGTADVLSYKLGNYGSENGELTIPSVVKDDEGREYKVTRIGRSAFTGKGHFTKLTLGDNIKSIERNSFIYTNIDELVLGDGLEEVPDNSFNSTTVKSLHIGASLKRIGKGAFYLSGLSKVTSKSPAFEVDDQAFFNCKINGGDWLSCITKIGYRAFAMNHFTEVPDFTMLEEVGSQAFYFCPFPNHTFVVPSKLKKISPDAFDTNPDLWYFMVADNPNFYCSPKLQNWLLNNNSTSLIMTTNETMLFPDVLPETVVRMEPRSVRPGSSIKIPSSVVEMEGAYKDYEYLRTLTCYATVPPEITEATFHEKTFTNRPWLYVPPGSEELYLNAPVWKRLGWPREINNYEPAPPQDRQYYMVVNATDENQQRVNIPISEVGNMQIADDGQHVVIKRNGNADLTVSLAAIDSVTWRPGFILDNAEVFDLNDSTLTVEAQKCTVKFDATCIDGDVQLSVRNAVLTPKVMEGVTRGFAVDLSLSNGEHELSGAADIIIPVSPEGQEKVCAAYYNEAEGQWEPVRFKHDEASGTVTITTNHLSLYSVFYTKNDFTSLAMLNYYGMTPTLYDIDDAIKKLLHIVSSDDPDAQMVREFKDEMGFWQSVGLDGVYNAVTSITEPLLDFKPEALDHAVTAMGYLGTAMSILDVVGADIKGDDVGVVKGTLSTVLNYTGGQMAAAIGTPIMAASSACVAFIGIALDKLYTSVMEKKRDMFREAYQYYYSQQGFNALIGDSKYKIDDKNPHGYFRTTKDWYNHFYPIIAEGKLTKDKLEGVIEQTVRLYCDRFWDDNEEVRTWSYEYAKTQGLSSYMWISEADKEQISNEYYAELMNGEMVSVIAAIKRNVEIEAQNRYSNALKKVAAIVNTQYRLAISDSSAPKDGKSKFAGWTMRFANIPSTVSNEKEWECTIGDDGTATLGYFTVYSLLQNEMPFEVVLCDKNGIEKKSWKFSISENTGKRRIKIDLANSGVEVEAPKLKDLTLAYDPAVVQIPMTIDGNLYYYELDELVAHPHASTTAIPCYLNGSFNKQARFQYEIEKFFKQHDFITVDDAGHVKIGDDIVGTMTGNEGSGQFTINTKHKFVEKTKQEFVHGFNRALAKGGDVTGIFNLLNGTIKHKIDCEFTVVRNADNSYTVAFTGTGTYNLEAEGVALVENYDWSAQEAGVEQKITVDDISTGMTEAEGTVKLQYTVNISM